MLNSFYEGLQSETAKVIIALSIMLFSGFILTRVTKLLKLPNVTAYIVAGILIGPFVLGLVPASVIQGTGFLADVALAFISFSVGEFFKLSSLKKNGLKTVVLTLCEALSAAILIFVLTFFILSEKSTLRTSAYSVFAPNRSAPCCIFIPRENPSMPSSNPG